MRFAEFHQFHFPKSDSWSPQECDPFWQSGGTPPHIQEQSIWPPALTSRAQSIPNKVFEKDEKSPQKVAPAKGPRSHPDASFMDPLKLALIFAQDSHKTRTRLAATKIRFYVKVFEKRKLLIPTYVTQFQLCHSFPVRRLRQILP